MKKLTIPVEALESDRINKGIRRLVREGFLKDNPDSQICRVRNAAAGATWRTLRDLERLVVEMYGVYDTHAGVWLDDSQIKRIEAEWGPVTKGGKVELRFSEVMQCAAC
ncbi:hypothetical protein ACMGG9_07830 [Serratia sp. BNK-10]|uniref:hypothetical protein n=1 Tax=Serratia sp. BNK-10 TaxID=3376147 RepID=UPI0039BED684